MRIKITKTNRPKNEEPEIVDICGKADPDTGKYEVTSFKFGEYTNDADPCPRTCNITKAGKPYCKSRLF